MATNSYINPGVTVSVLNTPVVNSTANNPLNICIMGDMNSNATSSITDNLYFKDSNTYNILSSSYVAQDATTKRPLITAVSNPANPSTVYTMGTNYQASWVNGTTAITSMPCVLSTPIASSYVITAASGSGTTQTYTTSSNSPSQPFASGSLVTISGITTATGYNATNAIITAVGGTSGAWTFGISGTTSGGSPGYSSATAVTGSASGTFTLTFALNGTSTTFTTAAIAYSNTIATLASNIASAVQTTFRLTDATATVAGTVGSSNEVILTVTPTPNTSPQNIITYASSNVSSITSARGYTISAASGTGSIQTYTSTSTVATQPFVVGSTITIANITTATGYNATNAIITAVGGTSGAWTFGISGTTSGGSPGYSSATANYSSTSAITVVSYATAGNLKSQTLNVTYTSDLNSAYGNKLLQFNSYSAVVQQFGNALTTSTTAVSSINSPITLAVQLAFQNNASQIFVFPIKRVTSTAPATATDWSTAFTALQTVNGISAVDTIVPLVDYNTLTNFDKSVFANYLSYQQNYSVLQRMFISQDTSSVLTQQTTAALDSDAAYFSNQRISLIAPTCIQIPTSSTSSNGTLSIAGYYAAAAIAGLYASLPGPQEPLTHKNVLGFSTINPTIAINDYQTLQSNGILCLKQKVDGTIYVRHGLTTNNTNWLTEEISIVAAQDALYNSIKNTLDNSTVIGSALTQNTANAVVSLVQGTLNDAVNKNLIQAYQGLQFQQSQTLPATITVTFQYSPTFPLNYVNVQFSINPQAGTVSFNTVTNAYNTPTGA